MDEWQIAWTATAVSDLGDLVDHIAQDDPGAALTALQRLRTRAAALRTHPQRGRIVPELREAGALHYRELVERPWRILYRIKGDVCWCSPSSIAAATCKPSCWND